MPRMLSRLFDNKAGTAAGHAADTLALNHLTKIDVGAEFLPWTRAAMRPSTILHILNELFINDRRSIIEFGAGISTIYLAWAAKKKNSYLLSIEENEDWCKFIQNIINENKLSNHCQIEFIQRKYVTVRDYTGPWYDVDQVKKLIGDKSFDLVVVDGPTAFRAGESNARRPAIDVLETHLADRHAIFLDDATRDGEREVLAAWEAILGEKAIHNPIAGGHAFLGRGDRYFSGL